MSFALRTACTFGLAMVACASSVSAQGIHALRFDEDGTVDIGFGTFGEAVVPAPGFSSSYAYDVALQGDKIVIAGSGFIAGTSAHHFMVARLNANGTLDTTFSQDGFVFVNEALPGHAAAVAVHKGKIVAAGEKTVNGVTSVVVARFLITDGSPDPTFGINGVSDVTFPGYQARANALAIMPLSARVVVAGSREALGGTDRRFMVVRLKDDGTLDPTFSSDGKQVVDFVESANESGRGVLVTSGKTEDVGFVAVAGTVLNASGQERCGVTMLGHDGERLDGFDGDGRKVIGFPYGTRNTCEAIKLNLGRILLGGEAWSTDLDSRFALTRMSTGGVPDTSFSGDGYMTVSFPGFDSEGIWDLAVTISSTTIVAVGGASSTSDDFNVVTTVAQINWDGTLDVDFSTDGKTTYDAPAWNINVGLAVAIEPDDQVVTVGFLDFPM